MTFVRVTAGVCALVVLQACTPAEEGRPDAPTPVPAAGVLSADGFGPVRVGMRVDEAAAALGAPLQAQPFESEACVVRTSTAAPPGVAFLTREGRVSRISVYGESVVRADSGVRLGAEAAEAERAHGAAVVSVPHEIAAPPARKLVVWDEGRERGLAYVIGADGRVVEMHGGDETIRWPEACS